MNEKTNSTKKKNKLIPVIVILLLLGLCGGGYYAYTQGYLDQFLNRKVVEEPVVETEPETPDWKNPDYRPADYKEPTIEFKDGFENGRIIIKAGEKFNPRDFIKITSYNGRGQLIVDLVGVEDTTELEEGVYSGFLTYRDMYKAETSVPFSLEIMPEETTEEEIEVIKKQTGHWEERTETIPAYDEKVVKTKAWTEKILTKEAWTETKTIPAYDEKVLVKAAWDERVMTKEAWDEPYEFCTAIGYDKEYVYICGNCGYVAHSADDIHRHVIDNTSNGCGNYSGQYIDVGEQHCLSSETRYKHHEAEYEIVHHDAEYKTVHHDEEVKTINHPAEYRSVEHPAEYETVHHEATTRTYKVWVTD